MSNSKKTYKVYGSEFYPSTRTEHHCYDNDWGKCGSSCIDISDTSSRTIYTFVEAINKADAIFQANKIYGLNSSNEHSAHELTSGITAEEAFRLQKRALEINELYYAENGYSKLLDKPKNRFDKISSLKTVIDSNKDHFYNVEKVNKEYVEAEKEYKTVLALRDTLYNEMEDIYVKLNGEHSYSYKNKERYSSVEDSNKIFYTETLKEKEDKAAKAKKEADYKKYLELKAEFEK